MNRIAFKLLALVVLSVAALTAATAVAKANHGNGRYTRTSATGAAVTHPDGKKRGTREPSRSLQSNVGKVIDVISDVLDVLDGVDKVGDLVAWLARIEVDVKSPKSETFPAQLGDKITMPLEVDYTVGPLVCLTGGHGFQMNIFNHADAVLEVYLDGKLVIKKEFDACKGYDMKKHLLPAILVAKWTCAPPNSDVNQSKLKIRAYVRRYKEIRTRWSSRTVVINPEAGLKEEEVTIQATNPFFIDEVEITPSVHDHHTDDPGVKAKVKLVKQSSDSGNVGAIGWERRSLDSDSFSWDYSVLIAPFPALIPPFSDSEASAHHTSGLATKDGVKELETTVTLDFPHVYHPGGRVGDHEVPAHHAALPATGTVRAAVIGMRAFGVHRVPWGGQLTDGSDGASCDKRVTWTEADSASHD